MRPAKKNVAIPALKTGASAPRKAGVQPLLVAIVGGSGAGKTWLAQALCAALGRQAARVSLDDFYRDRSRVPLSRRHRINFDHPRAVDWPEVETALATLWTGRPARLPRYDFKTHSRLKRRRIPRPARLVLVDGLWLLGRRSLRRLFARKIFVECPRAERLRRRLARDLRFRGRNAVSVRHQFRATVQPMHARFVEPQRRWADRVLPHDFSPAQARGLARELKALLRRQGAVTMAALQCATLNAHQRTPVHSSGLVVSGSLKGKRLHPLGASPDLFGRRKMLK